jgi:hypothetical protein
MKPTFQDKIEACKLASIEQIIKLKDFKCKSEERLVFDSV